MNQLPLSRRLYAKTRRAISPRRSPRVPPLTLIATVRYTPVRSTRRNNVKSGTPAEGPDVRSIAMGFAADPRLEALERDAGGWGNFQLSTFNFQLGREGEPSTFNL
jgi:hypothetical protein